MISIRGAAAHRACWRRLDAGRRTADAGAGSAEHGSQPPLALLLGWALAVTGRADKQFFSIGERDDAAVRSIRSILRLETLDQNFRPGQQGILRPAAAEERVWSGGFNHPIRDFAVFTLHVDVDPCVRINPFHLRDGSAKFDGLRRVKLGSECMMRPHR